MHTPQPIITRCAYLPELEYLVTAFVPSDTACLANSPGRMSLTEVWISRDEMVDFLLYAASLDASVATRSKMSGEDIRMIRVNNAREVKTYR
jgi:hypothetical protein